MAFVNLEEKKTLQFNTNVKVLQCFFPYKSYQMSIKALWNNEKELSAKTAQKTFPYK